MTSPLHTYSQARPVRSREAPDNLAENEDLESKNEECEDVSKLLSTGKKRRRSASNSISSASARKRARSIEELLAPMEYRGPRRKAETVQKLIVERHPEEDDFGEETISEAALDEDTLVQESMGEHNVEQLSADEVAIQGLLHPLGDGILKLLKDKDWEIGKLEVKHAGEWLAEQDKMNDLIRCNVVLLGTLRHLRSSIKYDDVREQVDTVAEGMMTQFMGCVGDHEFINVFRRNIAEISQDGPGTVCESWGLGANGATMGTDDRVRRWMESMEDS